MEKSVDLKSFKFRNGKTGKLVAERVFVCVVPFAIVAATILLQNMEWITDQRPVGSLPWWGGLIGYALAVGAAYVGYFDYKRFKWDEDEARIDFEGDKLTIYEAQKVSPISFNEIASIVVEKERVKTNAQIVTITETYYEVSFYDEDKTRLGRFRTDNFPDALEYLAENEALKARITIKS